MKIVQELIPFTFKVILFWYIVFVLLELLFPGFVTLWVSLDFLLWIVLLFALITILHKKINS